MSSRRPVNRPTQGTPNRNHLHRAAKDIPKDVYVTGRVRAKVSKSRTKSKASSTRKTLAAVIPKHMCRYCADSKPREDFPSTSDVPRSCIRCVPPKNQSFGDVNGPWVCSSCITRTVTSMMANNYMLGPYCPVCSTPWALEALRPFVPEQAIVKQENKMTQRLLESDSSFRWCAQDHCTSGQMYDVDQVETDPKVCCNGCGKTNCFKCRVPWHENQTCDGWKEISQRVKKETRNSNPTDRTLRTMRSQNTKRCPRCMTAVEKTLGCNHMICITCGHNYNWDAAPSV